MTDANAKRRPYVVQVETNVKGGTMAQLGFKTLIVGPPGSGKTRITQALELALTGQVSDVDNRPGLTAREVDLMSLAPGRRGELFAVATLSDQLGQASWRTGGTSGRSKKATHELPAGVDPVTVFPLRELVANAVGRDLAITRRWFLAVLGAEVTAADLAKFIPEALAGLYKKAAGASVAQGVDQLLHVLDFAEEHKSECAGRGRHQQKVVEEAGQGQPPLPTEEQYSAVSKALAEAQARLEALLLENGRHLAVVSAEGRLANLTEEYHRLIAEKARYPGELAAYAQKRAALEARWKALPVLSAGQQAILDLLRDPATLEAEACRVCGTEVVVKLEGGGTVAKFSPGQALATRKAQLEDWVSKNLNQDERTGVELLLEELGDIENRALEQEHLLDQQLHSVVQEGQQLRAQVAAGAPAVLGLPECRQLVAQYTAQKKVMDDARAGWATVSKARDIALASEEEANGWNNLAEACKTALASILDANITRLEARVQSYLPPGDKFALRLRDGRREVCQFGFVQEDGTLHTSLCGAESARMMAALAAACAPEEGLALVIPKDVGLDSSALQDVLQAFAQCPLQVVLATTTEPLAPVPGWTVLRTRAGEEPKLEQWFEQYGEVEKLPPGALPGQLGLPPPVGTGSEVPKAKMQIINVPADPVKPPAPPPVPAKRATRGRAKKGGA